MERKDAISIKATKVDPREVQKKWDRERKEIQTYLDKNNIPYKDFYQVDSGWQVVLKDGWVYEDLDAVMGDDPEQVIRQLRQIHPGDLPQVGSPQEDPAPVDPEISKYASLLGRRGGSAKTPVKARSSRENGKKGGRPKGSKNKPKPQPQE